ncbi:MAG: 30S ribosomal protein S21 [Candidatus Beckwithbacteria bacterium GW2011_GWB1_47_15]|uniref:Small ribosomal subunit protein bS21 n=1 Tax=Candidatus Beckwithbacteria bacterium GW2011_GWB1_47_15 TaxID=1618371 RepID=A0A0G1RWD3_9BACT|nr:MAG: 30S ribosomal protein S21, small subunit ribosomal protein S21 [Candidatus Beckwithbacteria bacterium GW2011_GWC1_49_16]KKU35341.1 MAG: 30S ribosomal protein S21 [Candidatus Beckwithbacteria bacterium GW2011_GWA1_46_30]KKU61436.1 MAG: 30S ribosomal protein S21 [Candidatus Beckwithbacteria bacterium GW2011_GWB1_47_15]KKU71843.1 MAG: 30S ribosomal protein S21 [Candidatus Beckwithbacteria bacterium GW2011_GWA2_47_25]KKW03737.1 MAG: 30S ribosomal protein S21 [Candidatus Beckwithbacteria bac
MPVVVKSQPGESTDQIIKKFKKKVLASQLLTKIRDRQYYKKPSVKKKEKLAEFKRRSKRRKRLRKKKNK